MEDSGFKEIVKNSHLAIIKGSLDRIMLFNHDNMMDEMVGLHIKADPPEARLITPDKFYVYKSLWQAILETLYENYLPNFEYSFNWKLEATAYTLLLCKLLPNEYTDELIYFQKLTGITSTEIEGNFNDTIGKMYLPALELPNGLVGIIPDELIPAAGTEHLNLLFRLMNFPPLTELTWFFLRYQNKLKTELSSLSTAFTGIDNNALPNYGLSEPLHLSYFQISHEVFKKYGIAGFKSNPKLNAYTIELEKIEQRAAEERTNYKDTFICSCCGREQAITLPEEILAYKFLLENRALCSVVALNYLPDIVEDYMQNLADKYVSFLPNINNVDNPDCLILVEGESEEAALPILAFRKRFILAARKIQVYNSKSKQKLAEDFLNFKNKYPKRKIICLLDADAVKEKNDIARVIRDHNNKYFMAFIEKGTFEDIFDLETSIAVINDMYPEGNKITLDDFDPQKEFLSNINRILFDKKKAKFDKVKFARLVSIKIDIERLPQVILDIFNKAELFTNKKKFVAN